MNKLKTIWILVLATVLVGTICWSIITITLKASELVTNMNIACKQTHAWFDALFPQKICNDLRRYIRDYYNKYGKKYLQEMFDILEESSKSSSVAELRKAKMEAQCNGALATIRSAIAAYYAKTAVEGYAEFPSSLHLDTFVKNYFASGTLPEHPLGLDWNDYYDPTTGGLKEDVCSKEVLESLYQKGKKTEAGYTIQVEAYKDLSSAITEKEKLEKMGYYAYLSNQHGFKVIYVGQYQSRDEAKKSLSQLKKIYPYAFIKKIKNTNLIDSGVNKSSKVSLMEEAMKYEHIAKFGIEKIDDMDKRNILLVLKNGIEVKLLEENLKLKLKKLDLILQDIDKRDMEDQIGIIDLRFDKAILVPKK